jgi:uncharacterized glyoxalase superfamily protein PhnB
MSSPPIHPVIIPTMRYRDAFAAIDWLCRAFGFEKHAVRSDANGIVQHAQLTYRGGMIMLSSLVDSAYSKMIKQPFDIGGCETQAPYLIVPDADAHYATAKAAGAEILIEIKTESYGGRGYTCRDPEGHIWSFGTYDPWVSV